MSLDNAIRQCKGEEIIERLKLGVMAIVKELDMDEELAKVSVESKSKDELIDLFCKLKELRLKEENLRLVSLLTD